MLGEVVGKDLSIPKAAGVAIGDHFHFDEKLHRTDVCIYIYIYIFICCIIYICSCYRFHTFSRENVRV